MAEPTDSIPRRNLRRSIRMGKGSLCALFAVVQVAMDFFQIAFDSIQSVYGSQLNDQKTICMLSPACTLNSSNDAVPICRHSRAFFKIRLRKSVHGSSRCNSILGCFSVHHFGYLLSHFCVVLISKPPGLRFLLDKRSRTLSSHVI